MYCEHFTHYKLPSRHPKRKYVCRSRKMHLNTSLTHTHTHTCTHAHYIHTHTHAHMHTTYTSHTHAHTHRYPWGGASSCESGGDQRPIPFQTVLIRSPILHMYASVHVCISVTVCHFPMMSSWAMLSLGSCRS